MKSIHIQASTHSYDVSIGEKIRFQLHNFIELDAYSSIFVITDQHVADLYGTSFLDAIEHKNVQISVIPSGEQSKSMEQFYELHTKALTNGMDRKGLIVAFGGGVVGDVAGFVAATLLRGVDYIQVPTTILAHDSSVGGKVAINHPLGKNLIGNFYAPRAVVFDVDLLKTLPAHEVRSGYAELIKEALIDDTGLFEQMIASPLASKTADAFIPFIQRGIEIKARIVEEDEKESGIRAYLNLGHTLAHAIEANKGYGSMTHGEAVAIGLLFALYVSEKTFSTSFPVPRLYEWFTANGYPITLNATDVDELVQLMKHDKKVKHDQLYMVLLKDIGEPTLVQLSIEEMTSLLKQFIKEMHTW